MGYTIGNYLNDGWFKIIKDNKSYLTMEYILDKYDINLDDYWILKRSGRFRVIDLTDIEKYAGIICFRKDMFKKEDIDTWLRYNLNLIYLDKPFPPVELLNKIKIVEWDI